MGNNPGSTVKKVDSAESVKEYLDHAREEFEDKWKKNTSNTATLDEFDRIKTLGKFALLTLSNMISKIDNWTLYSCIF